MSNTVKVFEFYSSTGIRSLETLMIAKIYIYIYIIHLFGVFAVKTMLLIEKS